MKNQQSDTRSIKELALNYRAKHILPHVGYGDLVVDPRTYKPYMEVHDAMHEILGLLPNFIGERDISLTQTYITDKSWRELYKCMSPQPLEIEKLEEYVRKIKEHPHGKNIIRRLKRNLVKQREKWNE